MSTEIKINAAPEIVEQKKQAWSKMGESVYLAELTLQAISQQSLANIQHPTDINQVPDAESKLTQLKKDQKVVESKRKEITSPLDELAKRLMQNEKSFDEPIKALSQAIIGVKSAHEAKQRELRAKDDEMKQIIHNISNYIAESESSQLRKIERAVNKLYENALGENDIHPASIALYLQEAVAKITKDLFFISNPIITSRFFTQEELTPIIDEKMKTYNPDRFLSEFQTLVRNKFSDYEVAFSNKKEALLRSQEEEKAKLKAIEEDKRNKELAASLEASAQVMTPAVTGPVVKELKRSYEVDMPETIDSVLMIFAAFSANIQLCLPKLKVNKWFAFTPAQAANALAKVKCDDNNFQPSGIIFKEIEKL
jgi:hypothetical protein